MNNEILCYLIMFIFSIMIDVKLTPSGLWRGEKHKKGGLNCVLEIIVFS